MPAAAPPLFVVSDISKLRVYVNVPRNYVPNILVGTTAKLRVPEYPGRTFSATVVASAQAVNIASGTTRILLAVDNASGELMTGDFVNVVFDLPHPEVAFNVPAGALIFDQSGLRIATVEDDSRVLVKTSHDLARSRQDDGNRVRPHRQGPRHQNSARRHSIGRSRSVLFSPVPRKRRTTSRPALVAQ